MKSFYNNDIKDIYLEFDSCENGLTNKIIEKNLKKYGKNIIKEKEKKSTARVFLEQFKDTLVIILIVSAIISIFLNELESTIVIFIVLTINAILGTYQYQKAEKSLTSLRNLSSPITNVIRENRKIKIKSYEIVCGDIVIVNSGDVISADGRIIEEDDLEINESSITGESIPVKKIKDIIKKENLDINEQKNMLFSGTFCTKGHAKYIVTKVGMDTEIGKIAKQLNSIDSKNTPLQNSLDSFSKYLSIIIIVICLLIMCINIYRQGKILDSLMFAVALAVAAIPEALSTIVTIVLAIGTEKMAKENAIIKDLKSVESLGCISVICTDKTGTLTTNKMIVKETINYINLDQFKKYVLLSTNYDMLDFSNNPTDNAIIEYSKDFIQNDYKKIQELSFTSDRKLMSNLYKLNEKYYLFTKGAIDILISKCSYLYTDKKELITNNIKDEILIKADSFAKKGRRIIGFAYKEINNSKVDYNDEQDLNFIGFITIMDPPREETIEAVKKCKSAGIKPVMLTGDYKPTAVAIAKEIGIYSQGDIAISGKELDELTKEQLEEKIENVSVYARLNPSQKIRIVEAWQSKNKIVAMTGDGVNDALALARADVSIAMGNGTEVAKDASSMILTDNNFDTIVKSVANGRKIYLNIQNAIRFLISGNLSAILIVLLTSFNNLPIPFLAIHLLFINLLTDSLPAIAIGMQEYQKDLLKNKPRNKKEHFITKKLILKIFFEGVLIFICCFSGYLKGLKVNVETARTMAFIILCMARLWHSFNCATRESFLITKKLNKFLIGSFILGIILINLVMFVPFLKEIFIISDLNIDLILSIYCYSILPTIIIQIIKLFK